jgi:hypothetical protein
MRIVISGTYSTGKTTMTLALAHLTGLPKTHASTMREILPRAFPGKRLEQCKPHELIELGLRRFTERVAVESSMPSHFVTDGCSLQEWVYGTSRLVSGLNPSENKWKVLAWKYMHYPRWKVFKETIDHFGLVMKQYAKTRYDVFIHLPVEFPFVPDGHRPVSETFRLESDELLRRTYKELNIVPFEISGNLEERLVKVIECLDLKQVMTISQAVALATSQAHDEFDSVEMEYANF